MAIHDFGLRVSLTVTKPQLTAKDDKATDDAERANNASGAGQYRKDLFPKDMIAPINAIESAARSFIKNNTIDSVVPSASFMRFADSLAPFETQFNQAVTVFMQNYSNILTSAQQHQGGLFDASLYPDVSALRQRFTWLVHYDPVADHSTFARVMAPMEDAAKQHLTNAITQQIERQQASMVDEALNKLKSVVSHMAVATARTDRAVTNKKTGGIEVRPPIFRNSLVENIAEITGLLDAYAAALPVEVIEFANKAKALTTANAETLKNDVDKRKAQQALAAALAAEIDGYWTGAPVAVPTSIITPQDTTMEQVHAELALNDVPVQSAPVATRPAPKEYDLGGLMEAIDNGDF